MAGIKESPRQRMIGMMYLVLTALLALNVSKEVLQAFNNLTRGISETVMSTEEKIRVDVAGFKEQIARMDDDSLAQLYLDRVEKAVSMSDTLFNKIESVKKIMVEAEENQKYDDGPESFKGSNMLVLIDEDNTDVPSRILADPNQANKAYGKDLKELINYTKNEYVKLFNGLPNADAKKLDALQKAFTLTADDDLTNPDISKRNWEFTTFNNVPLGAALAILTKIQNDLRNTESMVVSELTSEFSNGGRVVNGLQAMVMPSATNVPIGSSYEADIFLGAQLSSVAPIIEVDGKEITLDGSTGKYKIPVTGEGKVTKPIKIKLLDARTGITEEFATELSYEGFKTPAIISAEKMNVFYMGLDNPVSVSVPGFEPNKINVSLSPSGMGSISKNANGLYSVKINNRSSRTCKINVSVRMDNGSTRALQPQEFRVKKVPKPYANLNNKTGGTISRAELPAVRKVLATMDQEFLFDGVRFKVSNYDYIYNPSRGNAVRGSSGSDQIPASLKEKFNDARTGDVLTIYQIYAKPVGFGEKVMLPGSLTFTVR